MPEPLSLKQCFERHGKNLGKKWTTACACGNRAGTGKLPAMIRLVQLSHPSHGRKVARVDEQQLRMVEDASSVYQLAGEASAGKKKLEKLVDARAGAESLDYDAIYLGKSQWSLLPPFDHPSEPARCFVTGTGLTHKASAQNRQSMHGDPKHVTDSMKMYQIGLDGGRPAPGRIGAPPEWFYKGVGSILQPHNAPLDVPNHADDGGEESELAGCYVVAGDGTPCRVGFVQGNEFSDHVMEAKNYLYLAQSKLRSCSIGPEIVVGSDLSDEIRGHASIERGGKTIWAGPLASGEPWMCHTVANLEHHHFKHAEHRRPGDAHVHFFGADLFSFKERLQLQDGDVMIVAFQGFGRALRNPIRIDRSTPKLVKVKPL
jgi:hypothetical protein